MNTILIILFVYLVQGAICGVINAIMVNRLPVSLKDFMKLTFLPWLLCNLKNVKYK